MHAFRRTIPWAAALLALALLAVPAGAYRPGPGEPIQAPEAPVIGPTSWSDTLDDAAGLSWLESSLQMNGQVNLSTIQPLSADVSGIQSLAEGPDGVFYLGTDEAELWSYDPATGVTTSLGPPVPDECNN